MFIARRAELASGFAAFLAGRLCLSGKYFYSRGCASVGGIASIQLGSHAKAEPFRTEGGNAAGVDVACHIHVNKVSRYDPTQCPS
jgi:hypothetical protein